MIVCYSGGGILLDISLDVTVCFGSILLDISMGVIVCCGECVVLSVLSLGVTVCCGGGGVLLGFGERC